VAQDETIARIYPGEKPWTLYECAPHPLDAMTDDEKEAHKYLLDVLWYSEDEEEIKLYRILLNALQAPYLKGVE
tara:strand:+ start:3365 stop:3586 length:222 start_codon:yes stop_codon:yes gene_type:complete